MAWYNSSWLYRKPFTINSTTYVSGSVTNLPVFIDLALDTNLAALAKSDGTDILFTSSDGQTQLYHHLVTYATGSLTTFVRVPSLSGAANTTIYMYYGNAVATGSSWPTAVWSSNFTRVWFMNEAGGGGCFDQVSANTIVFVNPGAAHNGAGIISPRIKTQSYNGSTNYDTWTPPTPGIPSGSAARTWMTWVRPSTVAAGFAFAVTQGEGTVNGMWGMGRSTTTPVYAAFGNDLVATGTLSAGSDYHTAFRYNGAQAFGHLNGAIVGSAATTYATLTTYGYIGARPAGTGRAEFFAGLIGMFRVATTDLGASYVNATFATESPATSALFAAIGSQETDTSAVPYSNVFNWFYDASYILKNDARCVWEVRQYNAAVIPNSVPWKPVNPDAPIPLFVTTTGSAVLGHWSFKAWHPTASVYDLSGRVTTGSTPVNGTLVNSKVTVESLGLLLSRRGYPILGGGTTGYNLSVTGSAPMTTSDIGFSWQTYVYGLDAATTASYLSFIRTGSSGTGFAIEFDTAGQYVKFRVASASVSSTVTASIAPYLQESGTPSNFHYFAGSFIPGSGLYLFIDGRQVATASVNVFNTAIVTGSAAFNIRNGKSMAVDEFLLTTSTLDANDAAYIYGLTKERQRYLGLPSGSFQLYHQARFTVFASGSNEWELHSFSLRGLQNTSASIFDQRLTDIYSLPVFSSVSGSGGQSIGQQYI